MRKMLHYNEEKNLPSSSIFVNIARGAVWLLGVCIMLSTCYGVDVSAAITALGIGGIAISLGFQDTIANLIGGLQVSLLRIIKPGDNIEVGSSSGVVKDITWRHTTIRNSKGEEVVIPNSIINKTALTHLPPTNQVSLPIVVVTPGEHLNDVAAAIEHEASEAAGSVAKLTKEPKLSFSAITDGGFRGRSRSRWPTAARAPGRAMPCCGPWRLSRAPERPRRPARFSRRLDRRPRKHRRRPPRSPSPSPRQRRAAGRPLLRACASAWRACSERAKGVDLNEKRLEGPGPLHRGRRALRMRVGHAAGARLRPHAHQGARVAHQGMGLLLVNDGAYAVALTLGDLGYLGLVSASVIDFAQAAYKTTSVITPFPLGRFRLPSTSREGSSFENGRVSFRFEAGSGERRLHARFAQFDGDDDLVFDAVLSDEPEETMVIATPWAEDPLAFYYNQKIVAMRARGSFKKGLLVHGFAPDDSFGLLDWGRGVWTRDNTWFWGVAQGWQDGQGGARPGSHCFGLNLGYGFGDTSAASENMAFVDGTCHKLHRVDFGVPEKPAGADARKVADRYDLLAPGTSPTTRAASM